MAVYIMLTTLTDEGRKTVKANPERIREVNKEVEAIATDVVETEVKKKSEPDDVEQPQDNLDSASKDDNPDSNAQEDTTEK